VFSLGVLAYELTTQARAFHAASQFETMQRTLHGEITPPSQIVPGYPTSLEDVIMTALEVDPDDRFQDAEAMRSALDHVARELGLALGAGPVIRVLEELFDRRSEPWVSVGEETPELSDPSIVVVPALPERVARGTVRIDLGQPDPIDLLSTTPFERVQPATEAPRLALPAPPPTPVPSRDEPVLIDEATPLPPPAPPRTSAFIPAQRPSTPFAGYITRQREAARAPRTFAKVAIAAVVLGLGFAGGAFLLNQSAEPAPEPAAVPAPAAPVATPKPVAPRPAPAPVAKPTTIQLAVTTQPAGATVVLDGVRLGTTPYTATVPAKAAQGWLKVRMHGRVAVKTRVPLDHDVRWDVQLQPLAR
jgi:serine/threonine-protein kinase